MSGPLYEILLGSRVISTVSVDNVKDRIYDHAIINRKIRAFYDDWHTGEIMWYNTKRDEYRVLFCMKFQVKITLHWMTVME